MPTVDERARAMEWTCFFCNETYTDPLLARDHFGYVGWEPGCLNKLVQTDQSRRMELVRTETAYREAIKQRNEALAALTTAINQLDEARAAALEECALIADFEASQWPGTDSLMRMACKVIARKIRANIKPAAPSGEES